MLQSSDGVERAVLARKVVGEDAMPGACLALYEANPSRDLWKASMLTWLEQVHSKCSGCFGHYYLKCALDHAFAVRRFDPATISWWPTECPAYLHWYELLFPDRSLTWEEKFQVLCTTYLALNRTKTCSLPDALAQTYWLKMEQNGRLRLVKDHWALLRSMRCVAGSTSSCPWTWEIPKWLTSLSIMGFLRSWM